MEALTATTADGVALALRRFVPAGERRAVLLCTHAMMANGGYMHRRGSGFAGGLAERGVEVYVLDWRGHGASVPPSPRADDWCFDDYVELDLPAAIAAVCDTAGIEPGELCYLGHSLGGVAGLAAIGTGVVPAPRQLLLVATSLWLPGPAGPRYRRWGMQLYRHSARLLGHAPIRRLRLGSDDEPRGYVDQLTGWALSGRWTSRAGVDYLAQLRHVTSAARMIVGAGDKLCGPADARVMGARLPGEVPLRLVGRAHGDAIDPDHFTLFTCDELTVLRDELAEQLG